MFLSLDIPLLIGFVFLIFIIESKSANIAIEVYFTLQNLARD